jgi:Rrf2 family protein
MIEIASDTSGNGVFQKDIGVNQDISIKYLDHIISALKGAGLIISPKGKKSGYVLTRSASEITMLDIHCAFENGICVIDCMDVNFKCEREHLCKSKDFWKGLNDLVDNYFSQTTLADLVNKSLK